MLNDVRLFEMVGFGGITVNVTVIVCGLLVAPEALIVIVALYVPAVKLEEE